MVQISKKITGEVVISSDIFKEIQKEIKNISDFEKKIKSSLNKKTTELLEIILSGSIALNASDIHFEPKENELRIRLRIDGILQDILTFNLDIYQSILSRIKLLSAIKLDVANRPQDGRFSIIISDLTTQGFSSNLLQKEEPSIEIRTSSLPTEYGESIVLRVLNPKSLIKLADLGLRKDLLKIIEKQLKKPSGMIIVTGPTGSGKTTTLYAFLKKIKSPEIKIITIEDPIEYHLKEISQTQVNPKKGYDFPSGLQSLMRQDPDVILVGEIRDIETAKIAIQAALTGHLVFTTLHANDAAGTVARLTSLGAQTSNIGPAINMAIAQRLIRNVCKKCAEFIPLSEKDLKTIKNTLKGLPKNAEIPKLVKNFKIPIAKGCKYCNMSGFIGQIGIFEVLLIDDETEKFILKNPSIASLREFAVKKGMISVEQDGLIKVLKGITTLKELERVTSFSLN